MEPRHEPDQVDPTQQSGRPLMVTLVPIGLLLALAILVGVFFLTTLFEPVIMKIGLPRPGEPALRPAPRPTGRWSPC